MNQLKLIIKREYLNDIKSKSFWIGTFVVPLAIICFGMVMGFLATESETLQSVASMGQDHNDSDFSGAQLAGMLIGMFLVIFLMMYGTLIFNKVKSEKANRIMEILATCVPGRTMMLGKVIAVGLIGMTQLLAWGVLLTGGTILLLSIFAGLSSLLMIIQDFTIWLDFIYAILFLLGGYLLYGSLYACVGAMSDKDNENQGYIVLLTMTLMVTFYISQYTVDNPASQLAIWCTYIPFTSPSIAAVGAITGSLAWWEVLISLIVLYASAYLTITTAGKIYTSAMLLNGKKFSVKDIAVFIKAK